MLSLIPAFQRQRNIHFVAFVMLVSACLSFVACKKDGAKTLPALTTSPVTFAGVDAQSVSGGNITSDGGADVTARGVCWTYDNKEPTIADQKTTDGAGTGAFTSTITIAPGATGYVRAYATNSVGTAYGNKITFTQPEILPVVTSIAAELITAASVKLSGSAAAPISRPTEVGIYYSKNANSNTTGTKVISTNSVYTQSNVAGLSYEKFSTVISGLSPNTTYYYRAYASNTRGTGYGGELTFKTLP